MINSKNEDEDEDDGGGADGVSDTDSITTPTITTSTKDGLCKSNSGSSVASPAWSSSSSTTTASSGPRCGSSLGGLFGPSIWSQKASDGMPLGSSSSSFSSSFWTDDLFATERARFVEEKKELAAKVQALEKANIHLTSELNKYISILNFVRQSNIHLRSQLMRQNSNQHSADFAPKF
jgi:hypothetical protein